MVILYIRSYIDPKNQSHTAFVFYLKWQDNHKHSLLSVSQYVLDEGPSGADENDGEEKECAFQQVGYVIKHGPETNDHLLGNILL